MIYPIVVYGNPVLKKKARDLEKDEIDVKALAEDMFETMYNASGIGLAAPQIGKSLRMFVVDATALDEPEYIGFKKVFINPEIIEETGDEWAFEEGCLSIPEIREEVYRPENLRMRYFDENWEEHEEEFDEMKARIIQHEYDHIEGILFTDHLSAFKKRLLKSRLLSISKGKVQPGYRILAPLAK
jgi:peptide deformylase